MLRSLWLLALTLLCACRAGAPRPMAAPTEPPLPEVFGPLDWRATAASLRARFPEAKVVESPPRTSAFAGSENGRELLLIDVDVWGAHLEPFGTVDIQVMGFQGQPAAVLVIHRSDNPGSECYRKGSTEEQQQVCYERLVRERRKVYDPLAAQLIARYGAGKLGHLESEEMLTEADPVELEQSERIWSLPGLELRLALGEDPRYHGIQVVRLVASRDPRYPY